MEFEEKRMNLFCVSNDYYFAHCISSDCNMDVGIAEQFQKKFSLRNKLLSYSVENRKHPSCIKVGRVFNLITKSKYYGKPTYETVKASLLKMQEQVIAEDIKKIAMPKIASNLDKLSWGKVREIIQEVFKDTDIHILVCHI
jgi:hypothetical protein